MQTRREFLNSAATAALSLSAVSATRQAWAEDRGILVNDVHSQLNATRMTRIVTPASPDELRAELQTARAEGRPMSIAGGRHAMGGQQFASDAILIDTRAMNRVLSLDAERGVVEVEAGIQWPDLIGRLAEMQQATARPWSIIQKQTGADRLTIGGALAANIHGRGLAFKPIIGDVESFTLLDAEGRSLTCSRDEHSELFRLVIGGYGLFGVVTRVKLKLMPRTKLERLVKIVSADTLVADFEAAIADGFIYGDYQFSTDMGSDGFLRTGVFSSYRPLPPEADVPPEPRELSEQDWRRLYYLSHADTPGAFQTYTSYYLGTSGQRYWSDTHQLSVYIDDYHSELERHLGAVVKGSEMITELYVPRRALVAFLAAVGSDFRKYKVQLIYGTTRLIAADDESFLAWAREPWACTVMNLHIDHTEAGIAKAANDFRRLIDRAIEHGGSYFLTYHRWARREQVERCYPQMATFLRLKRQYDPGEVFQSDWYRHYKALFAAQL